MLLLRRCASRRHRRRYPCDVSETGSGCVRPLSLPVRRVVVGGQIWRGGTKPSILWVGFHPLCRPCIVIMPSPLPSSPLPPSWSCTYTRPPGEVTKCGVKAKPTPLRRPHVPQGERQGRQEAGIKTIALLHMLMLACTLTGKDHSYRGHSSLWWDSTYHLSCH